jgi:predicted nucleotidyltransferase
MDESSVWRQEVAIQVAQKYQSNPNITAIMLGGSTARGHTDKYSDIELGVFWNQPPTEEERMAAF